MFSTEVYTPSDAAWNEIKRGIIFLEREAFGDKAFDDEQIAKDFLNVRNTIVLLRDDGKIIGFTYAKPLDEADEPGRENEAHETAYIWDTVIERGYRGRHLVGSLMKILEEELRAKGYKYVERMAAEENNYAANIARHYGKRIVKSEPRETEYGRQVFFRIML